MMNKRGKDVSHRRQCNTGRKPLNRGPTVVNPGSYRNSRSRQDRSSSEHHGIQTRGTVSKPTKGEEEEQNLEEGGSLK
jgi:hypothetical protein